MITFYIDKQTCVELTETTLSTATTSLWLYTNRRCCTVVRSRVGGLGLATVVRGDDTVAGGCSSYLEGCVHAVHSQENWKRKSIVPVVTGFGVRVS